MSRVAIYARFSSDKQADGYSIEAQIEACRAVMSRGDKATEYIDRARSGSTLAGREALRRLVGDAADGKVDTVLVYKFDRLGRNQAETSTLIQDLEEEGVTVRSATEGDDPLARGMHLVFAEHYNRQLAERTRTGVIKAAEQGRIGGPAPLGYVRADDGTLRIDPDGARIVKRIFTDYATHGMSFKAIVRAMNSEGIRSPRGGNWHAPSILSILSNETYRGRLIFNQRKFRRDRKTGRRVYTMNPESDWLIQDAPELRIVSDETFEKVVELRNMRKPRSAEIRRTYAMSGMVRCSECGRFYVAQKSRNSKGEYVYLGCGSRNAGGPCGNKFRFRQDIVLPEIIRQVVGSVFAPESMRKMKSAIMSEARSQIATADDKRHEIQKRIGQTKARIERIMSLMIEAKEGTADLWSDRLAAENEALRSMELEAARLGGAASLRLDLLEKAYENVMEKVRDGLLGSVSETDQRHALEPLVGTIVAEPEGHIKYNAQAAGIVSGFPQLVRTVGSGGLLCTVSTNDLIWPCDIDYQELRIRVA